MHTFIPASENRKMYASVSLAQKVTFYMFPSGQTRPNYKEQSAGIGGFASLDLILWIQFFDLAT